MADIEKVKQGLDRCKHGDGKYCFVCPYAKENKKPFPPICNKELCNDALSVIEELQAEIERLQPKNGKWLEYAGDRKCSVCGSMYSDLSPEYDRTPFCPHCGAKMEGGDWE